MELVRKVRVRVDGGLHARPAAEIVRMSKSFASEIQIEANEQVALARSSLKLLMLSVKEGDEIVVRARGSDAETAITSIAGFLAGKAGAAPHGDGAAEGAAPAAQVSPATDAGSALSADAPPAPGAWRGVPVSGRRAIGPVFRLEQPRLDPEPEICPPEVAEAETRRAVAAQETVARRCREEAAAAPDATRRQVLSALAEIVADPDWSDAIAGRIAAGVAGLAAAQAAGEEIAAALEAAPDPYIRARAEDMRAAIRLVALEMQGKRPVSLADAPDGAVIVATELSAMDLGDAALDRFAGIVTAGGAANGHAAILARSAGVPAVFGLGAAVAEIAAARIVALDGAAGEVLADPAPDALGAWEAAIRSQAEEEAALAAYRSVRPVTRAGVAVTVAANIGSVADARRAAAAGAMGVGLFRTEFLFLDRPVLADEEEQFACYRDVLACFPEDEVIIRTLDIGGDKPSRAIPMEREENPFLGLRGIRLCLARPDVFRVQIRALLRAAPHGHLKVMVPMIAAVEELRAVRALVAECAAELRAEGLPHAAFPLGVMIETPAAAFLARELAEEADFFSIGTNDLTQYVMAADRTNPAVADLCRASQPAVLAAIRMICAAAREGGVPVGVCGEAAADPELAPLLIAAGVEELSVAPASVLRLKRIVGTL